MNFKAKNSNVTKSLYIILILCIISVVCLSIYAFFVQKDNGKKSNLLDSGGKNISIDSDNYENSKNDELLKVFGTTEQQNTPIEPQTERSSLPLNTEPASDVQVPNAEDSAGIGEFPEPKAAEVPEAEVGGEQVAANPDNGGAVEEAAVEVLAIPTFFLKPIAGSVAKIYNEDTPEYSVVMNDYRTHMGIDVESEIGANVKAVADGVVAEISDDPMMGKTLVISHNGGLESVYMNLQELIPQNIAVGSAIKAGDVIGGVGESSLIELSDVPHLHFAMKKDGEFIDPLKYVEY